MRKVIRLALFLVVLLAILGIASTSFTDDSISMKTNFFTDNGGLFVRSPQFQFVKDLARSAVLTLQYTLDRVSIPPYRGISAKPVIDGVTGASKPATDSTGNATYVKNRNELIAAINATRWGATVYYSSENDYTGRLVSAGFNQDFNQKNTNLSLRAGYGFDTIKPLGQNTVYTRRNILVESSLTQTLSPVTLMQVGLDVSRVTGFQNNPYRTVFVAGVPTLEQHPRERLRLAGHVKLNTYFRRPNASLWMDYRLYGDDWGIISHTLGLKFHQILSKRLLIRYRYRFYVQSAANFYRGNYSLVMAPDFFTDDYKLEPFNSHLFGFLVSYHLDALSQKLPFVEHTTLEVKYERFFTSNNFTANVYQVGLTVKY